MAKKPPVHRKRQQKAREIIVRQASQEAEIVERPPLTFAAIQAMRRNLPAVRTRSGLVNVKRATGIEFGASGTLNIAGQIMREDYNPLFDGKNGIAIFDQMDRSDGQVGAAGEIIKMPIRSATWTIEPPKDATADEIAIAETLHETFFGDGMLPAGEGWDFLLRHLLMRVPFGFGFVEKVWMFDEDRGIYRFRRLAPRLPRSVDRFDVDENGTLRNVIQYVSVPGTGRFEYRTIPAEYLCLSVREREGDNYWGKSIYRRLYKHWFYKDDAYRIEGIRLDRYGVGIPVAKIDEGHPLEADELSDIELTLMALRSHESAWLIEPPGVTFRIMTPEGGAGGVTGLMDTVNHHDSMIVKGILATFLSDHSEGLNTNRTATLANIFLHALKGEANGVRDDISTQLVRASCDVNFDMKKNRYPIVKYAGIGDLTVEQLQAVLAPLVGAGVITAEDSLEDVLRALLGLPALPKGWKRGDTKPDPLAEVKATAEIKAGQKNGPADKAGQNDPAANAGKANDQGKQQPIAASTDPIELATAVGEAIAASLNASREQGTKPEPVVVEVKATGGEQIESVLESIDALARSIEANAHPPEMPPIILNVGGGRVVKRIVRDENGRITGVESDEGQIELYSGQPRDRGGKFSFGKKATINRPASSYVVTNHGGSDTQARFSVNGEYTPERKKLHAAIVASYIEGKTPDKKPTAIILGGGSAAGKTNIVKSENLITPNTVHVDADEIRKHIPEYRERIGKNADAAAFVHEEASDIAKMLTREAADRKLSVVLDGTGDSSIDKLNSKVSALRASGHEIIAHYVTVPTDVAVERANARGAKTGRYVPESFIRSVHRSVSLTFNEAIKAGLFDEATVYDTSSGKKVLARVKGKTLSIVDSDGWAAFIAKGNE